MRRYFGTTMTALGSMAEFQHDGDRAPARARRRQRAQAARMRLLVLAMALILPTLAARGELGAFGRSFGLTAPGAPPLALAFETPGESFPGSAFYWLEETPVIVADLPEWRAGEGSYEVAAFAEAHGPAGAAAEAFRAGGSGLDKARALQCLSMAVYYEAASESQAGQEAVAQVVLNRVAHPAWPNSVCGVVFQGSERRTGCQFSFTCDGALARRPATIAWARAQGVALAALAGRVFTPVSLATHYHTNYVSPYWAPSLAYITTIGAHRFYRWKGKAGTAGAFSDRYSGVEGVAAPAPGSGTVPQPARLPVPPPANSALGSVPLAQPLPPSQQPRQQPAPDALPDASNVREEFRNSGRWINEPGKPRSN